MCCDEKPMEKRAHVKCVCSSTNSRAAFVALRQ